MNDWNVVATLKGRAFKEGVAILGRFGVVETTPFYNVVVLKVEEPAGLLPALDALAAELPVMEMSVAMVSPVAAGFTFQDAEEFQEKSLAAVEAFLPRLAGRAFHVRFHRRGFKGRLRTPDEEQRLAGHLLDRLEAAATPGRIAFDAAEAVVVVETVGTRAGLALWSRDDMARHRFLNID